MMAGTILNVEKWHSVNSQKLMLHRSVYTNIYNYNVFIWHTLFILYYNTVIFNLH